jgi:hypothetical protein
MQMNLFKRNTTGAGTPSAPPGKDDSLNPVLYVLAFIAMPFVQGAKKLSHAVYEDGWGFVRAILGVIFGFGGAIGAAHYVGWIHGFGWYAWLPSGFLAFLAVLFYIWPILWLFPIHPIWKLSHALFTLVHDFAKKYLGTLMLDFLSIFRAVCLGCDKAWQSVIDRGAKAWFSRLLYFLSYATTVLGSVYLGWWLYHTVFGFFPEDWITVATIAGAASATFVGSFVCATLCSFIANGKLPFLATVTGGLLTWQFAPEIAATGHFFGLPAHLDWIAYAISFTLYFAYLFPYAVLAMSAGFWKRVWKWIEPFEREAYDEQDVAYRNFFHYLMDLVAVCVLGYFAFTIATAAGFLPITAGLVTAAFVLAGYVAFFKVLDHGGGNCVIGVLTSLGAGAWAFYGWTSADLAFDVYGAIGAGVVAALAWGFFGYTLSYVVLREIAIALRISLLGKVFAWTYNHLYSWCKSAYETSYGDKSDYKALIVEVTNVAVACLAYYGGHLLVGLAGWGTLLAVPCGALAFALSYLLIGKLLSKDKWGLETIGGVASLVVAILTGAFIYGVDPTTAGKISAIAAAIATWPATYFIGFPVAYAVLRFLTNWILTFWLHPLLASVYGFFWGKFAAFWGRFENAYNRLLKRLAPVWARFARAWAAVAAAYDRLLKKIGRHG